MKRSNHSPRTRSQSTDAKGRAQWLSAFDHSGLSAAAFARQHGLHYTTFCGWRQRQAKTKPSSGFVQVESLKLPTEPAPVALLIELGTPARLRLHSTAQIDLAAHFLHRLNTIASC